MDTNRNEIIIEEDETILIRVKGCRRSLGIFVDHRNDINTVTFPPEVGVYTSKKFMRSLKGDKKKSNRKKLDHGTEYI